VFALESSNSRRVKNSNRRILVYLRILILSNNAEVGLYRRKLVKVKKNLMNENLKCGQLTKGAFRLIFDWDER
jgi:hypothetical protein